MAELSDTDCIMENVTKIEPLVTTSLQEESICMYAPHIGTKGITPEHFSHPGYVQEDHSYSLPYNGIKVESLCTETCSYLDSPTPSVYETSCDNSGSMWQIECSVCEAQYDNITEYTHHLNMHLDVSTQLMDDNLMEHSSEVSFPELNVDVTDISPIVDPLEGDIETTQHTPHDKNNVITFGCLYCNWQHMCHSHLAGVALEEHRKSCYPQQRNPDNGTIICKGKFTHEDRLDDDPGQHKKPKKTTIHMQNKKPIAKCPYCPWQEIFDGSFHDAYREHRKSCGQQQASTDTVPITSIINEDSRDSSMDMTTPINKDSNNSWTGSGGNRNFSTLIKILQNENYQDSSVKHISSNKAFHQKSSNDSFVCILCNHALSSNATLQHHMDLHARKCLLVTSTIKAMTINNAKPIAQDPNKYARVNLLDISNVSSFQICLKKSTDTARQNIRTVSKVKTHEQWIIGNQLECNLHSHKEIGDNGEKSSTNGQDNATKCTCVPCSICRKQLNVHNMHKNKLKRFPCTLCDKSFSHKCSLSRHVQFVHKELRELKLFSCALCNRSFRWKTELKAHTALLHNQQERKVFTCTLCKKSYLQKAHLDTHLYAVHYVRIHSQGNEH